VSIAVQSGISGDICLTVIAEASISSVAEEKIN